MCKLYRIFCVFTIPLLGIIFNVFYQPYWEGDVSSVYVTLLN